MDVLSHTVKGIRATERSAPDIREYKASLGKPRQLAFYNNQARRDNEYATLQAYISKIAYP
jgi:hypothetical protein